MTKGGVSFSFIPNGGNPVGAIYLKEKESAEWFCDVLKTSHDYFVNIDGAKAAVDDLCEYIMDHIYDFDTVPKGGFKCFVTLTADRFYTLMMYLMTATVGAIKLVDICQQMLDEEAKAKIKTEEDACGE